METHAHLQAFYEMSLLPMHYVADGESREYTLRPQVMAYYPAVEDELLSSGQIAVYTVSPEHIAFGLLRVPGGHIFFGPSPAFELTEEMLDEAMHYANQPEESKRDFERSLRGLPGRDILRFQNMMRYVGSVCFGIQVEQWYHVDYPPPIKGAGVTEIVKPAPPLYDVFSYTNHDFGTRVMNAIIHGKVDELEKELSEMRSIFAPTYESTLTKNELHDKFVLALAQASIAAMRGGLSHITSEIMIDHYLKLLSAASGFREIVRLFKTMLSDFAARVRHGYMITTDDTLTRRICRDIENHLHEKLTPTIIAGRLGVSVPYLCNQFKLHAGKTVSTYINERKTSEAKYLLQQNGASVTSVALQMGYTTASYFSTVFKAQTGISPYAFFSHKAK